MENLEYGFSLDKKTFDIVFLGGKNFFYIPHKELLIQILFNLIQSGKISHSEKEEILSKVLLDPDFPELMNTLKPMAPILKISYMVDIHMAKLHNPTVNMWAREAGQLPCASIFEESKFRGVAPVFPFFRFKEEGLFLLSYLYENGKISNDDLMVMRAQINKLPLPLSYLETYVMKTLKPATTQ